MTDKIALLGASGFLGSTVLDRLEARDDFEVTPFAGSTGGATALAHRGRRFQQIDILDRRALERALTGFDIIVNCSRGGDIVMRQGFDNLLATAKSCRIRKVVHISSVAVYGDPPDTRAETENGPTTEAEKGYGAIKLAQDNKLQKAARSGLGAVILCPPNIIGPYSDYLLDIIDSIERGRFALLEDGQAVLNVIDADSLAAAVERAIDSPVRDGRRLFVNHPEPITWRDLCDALAPVLRTGQPIPAIDAEALTEALANAPKTGADSLRQAEGNAFKHLVSEDVRDALKRHPRWAAIENAGKRSVRLFGRGAESYMRRVANGPIHVPVQSVPESLDHALVSQQLRRVKHRPDKCLHDLDMQLPIDFSESMRRFNAWYRRYLDTDSKAWRLLAHQAD